MRIIKKTSALHKAAKTTKAFLVLAEARLDFIKGMAAHGWKTISSKRMTNLNFYWCIITPNLEKIAAGLKTRPKKKIGDYEKWLEEHQRLHTPPPPELKEDLTDYSAGIGSGSALHVPPSFKAIQEVSNDINYANIDTDDPAMDLSSGLASKHNSPEKDYNIHPFHREHALSSGSPEFVRFMWNPWTGEMLVTGDVSQDHGGMLANYSRKLKNKGKKTDNFDAWIRGYYNPSDGSIMLRPWSSQGRETDPLAERVTGSVGQTIKSRLIELLAKELGVDADELRKKTKYYLNEDDLRNMYGTMRRF